MKRILQSIAGPVMAAVLLAAPALPQEGFHAVPVTRLFTAPTGRILPSMDVLFTVGGAYGTMNKGEYLGTAAVGLGDVAELEVSTWRLVSNLFNGSTALGTTAIKVAVLRGEESGRGLPNVAAAFRMSPSWSAVGASGSAIASDLEGEVSEVRFEVHAANLYLNLSKEVLERLYLHGGAFLTDISTRYGNASLTRGGAQAFPDRRESQVSGFLGFEREVNPRTVVTGEVVGVPRFDYSPADNRIDIAQVAMIVAGVRFHFARRISTDVGIKYRTDYDGIADAEINVGVNAGFNILEAFEGLTKVPDQRLRPLPRP
jgi:hypothetical protein